MQKLIVLIFLLYTILFGQTILKKTTGIPAGYYDPANGKTGTALKTALHNIINGHTRYPYTSSSTDVWDILMDTDEDTLNSNNVILIYTGRSQDKNLNASNGNDPDYWNREHVWAKSHGFPNSSDTAYTDVHHLRPADASVNSSRSNKDFDNGGSAQGEAPDTYTDSDSWEPRDAVKGDVARMMFYMATRYENDGDYDLQLQEPIPSSGPHFAKLSVLLQWNQQDPVDHWEQIRNDKIYTTWQHNRNPFIDHPEYADLIWGSQNIKAEPSNHPTNFTATANGQDVTLNWTDATGAVLPDSYLIKASVNGFAAISDPQDGIPLDDDTNLSDGNGAKNVAYGTGTYTFSALDVSTVYYFKIYSYTNSGSNVDFKTDGVIDTASATTAPGGGGSGSTELFISEYVEGTSNNKYLEIYNGTSGSVNLSAYDVQIYYNGNSSPGTTISLSGSVVSSDVFVMANSSADAWGGTPDMTSANLNFNGNDVVVLRKNSADIDMIGSIGSSANLFQDKTLRRKSSVSAPTTTYNSAEWDELTLTYDGLGSHTADSPLPVDLIAFTSKWINGRVQLEWSTASELENQGYLIERAQGSGIYMEIASYENIDGLKGAGTTSQTRNYAYLDEFANQGEELNYRLWDVSYSGRKRLIGETLLSVSGQGRRGPIIPSATRLFANYPNPFNPSTRIRFDLAETLWVKLAVYDLRGHLVETLLDGPKNTGHYSILWNSHSAAGRPLSSGIYFIHFSAGRFVQNRSMLLIK